MLSILILIYVNQFKKIFACKLWLNTKYFSDNSKCMNCICKSTSSSSLNFFLIGDSGGWIF